MFLLHCVMSLVLLLLAESGVGPSDSPGSYCTESKECLQFELVCQTEEYEVRHYSPTWWVSTDAEAYLMGVGAAMAFRRLYQYITGTNQAGIQMEMTAPVLVEVPEETHTWEPALYTLSFLLPSVFQRDRPPAPINDKVYFTEMPEMDVYVRSYGGWMLSVSSRLHTHLLTKELQRVNANYNHTHHYAVGYDRCTHSCTRRHEQVHKDTHRHTHTHSHTHVHPDTHRYTHTLMCIQTGTGTQRHTQVHTHTHSCTHRHEQVHTDTHRDTETHTHTQ
ncbi:heme-binding protein 2 isoform X1 [Ictalurus furcatus]|uniref:heme-binding protein 2 isoform X1 n=1 Tax=Ictalurus furcatus TaxID=66913 RepID=UPI002350B2BE|nr:heme-binding protein 2 isoform X1 [Ictalurus furcatus]